MGGCSRFDAKVVPIAVETDRKCGLNTPRAIVCDGRRFEIARVGATLPCPSMFGKADATVTGVLVDVGGRCVARGLMRRRSVVLREAGRVEVRPGSSP